MTTSCSAKLKFLRKLIKRTFWRLTNLSMRQFFKAFVLRRLTTVVLDVLPCYDFPPLNQHQLHKTIVPRPLEFFIMIKPSGLHKESEIKAIILQNHLHISREETYQNFFEIAAHLFNIAKIHDYRHNLPEGFLWLKLLELYYPETCQITKILYVANGNEPLLKRVKARIRKKIGVEFFRVYVRGVSFVTCMTPVHTSDAATLEHELKILRYFQRAGHVSDQKNSHTDSENLMTPLRSFGKGVQVVLPALFGMLPFAMISGIAAVEAGIPAFSALVMSVLVFAGASQLVVLDLMKQHGVPLIMILTGLVMNLRFAMYSAALAPHIRHVAARWKTIFAYLLTDQAFVVSVARFQRGYRAELKGWYYLGAAFSIWLVWQVGAAAGIFLGSQIPASWSLDFAVPLIFLSMLMPSVKDRASKAAAAASAITVVLAAALPLNLGLLAAAACGILVGFLTERSFRSHVNSK